jgi:hypothetical protein
MDTTGTWKHGSMSLIISEIQNNTTMRSYLTPVRMVNIKETKDNKGWWGCREKVTHIVGGNVNRYSNYGKQYGGFAK